jgi:hypothetical protein
VQKDR